MIVESKKVILKSKPFSDKVYLSNDEVENHKLTSVFDANGNVLNPLSHSDQMKIMPGLLNTDGKSVEFIEKVKNYWRDIRVLIPIHDGLHLEAGIQYETEEDKAKGNYIPINANHYVIYQFAMKHHKVANSVRDIYKTANIQFYFIDEAAEEKLTVAKQNIEDEALEIYLSKKSIPSDVENLLIALDVDTFEMTNREKITKLKEISTKQPNKLIKIEKNVDLKLIVKLKRMIALNLIRNIPNTEVYEYEDVVIADSFKGLIGYFKGENASNKKIINDLEAKLSSIK